MVIRRPSAGLWARTRTATNDVVTDNRIAAAPAGSRIRTTSWSRTWLRCAAALALVLLATPSLAADPTGTAPGAPTQGAGTSPTPDTFIGELGKLFGKDADDEAGGSSVAEESEGSDDDDGEGSIGIVGAFNGVSSFSPNSNGAALALESNMTSLLMLSESSATLMAAVSSSGQVTAACTMYNADGSFARAFMGGSMSSLNSTSVGYVFGIDGSGNVDSMAGGVNGPVNALYCDNDTQLVYVGGNFTSTVSGLVTSVATMRAASTGSLAVYAAGNKAWREL
ncbi:hypothetical protein IWW50_004067, partial [Coemansia erecta]